MKKFILYIPTFLLVLFANILQSQNTFEKIYHYGVYSIITDVIQSTDSGYFAANYLDGGLGYGHSLAKINKFGDTLWTQEAHGLKNLCLTNDGGIIGVGYRIDLRTGSFFKRIDESGNIIWETEDYNWPISILHSSENNYVFGNRSGYAHLNKINDNCDSIWSKSLNVQATIYDIVQTNDDGFAITAGHDWRSNDTNWLIKTDSLGDVLWSLPYDESIRFNSLCVSEDNGLLLAGYEGNYLESEVIVIKTDSLGNTIWQKSYDFGETSRANSICKTNDQDFVLAISNYGYSPLVETLIKIDNSGEIIWTRDFGDGLYDVKITNDNGIIAGGLKDGEAYLVKTNSEGLITSIDEGKMQNQSSLNIYPNPVNSITTLSGEFASAQTIKICIYNTTGVCLKNWDFDTFKTGRQQFTLSLNELPPGIYFLRMQAGNEVLTKKVVKI